MAITAGPASAREQEGVRRGQELGRPRRPGQQDRHAAQQQRPHPRRLGPDLPVHEAGGGRDRGPPLLRAQRRRHPGHVPRRPSPTCSPAARPRAPRRSPSSSSRTRSRRRAAERSSRSSARPRSPTSSSATGTRTRSSPSTSTPSTSARAPTASRPRPTPTSAGTTRAAGDAARACAKDLTPPEAAMLAGIISSPSAFSPRANPQAATDRRNLVLQDMLDQGDITQTSTTRGTNAQLPAAVRDPTPDRRLALPLLHLLAAPAGRRPLRRRRAFGGGSGPQLARPRHAEHGAGRSRESTLSGVAPTASVVVIDNADRRGQGDGRRQRLPDAPLQPGHQRPPAAGFGLQALHAGDRAEPGDLAQHQLRLEREDLQGPPLASTSTSTSTTTATSTTAAPASTTRRSTRTTRSTPSWRCGRTGAASRDAAAAPPSAAAPSGSRTPRTRWASRPSSRRTPRWSSARSTRASRRSRWRTPTRPSPTGGERVGGNLDASPGPNNKPDQLGAGRDRQGHRPERRHRRREQAEEDPRPLLERRGRGEEHPPRERPRRHRQARPDRRSLRVGQDRHHREQRRRLVLRRHRPLHRPASGSATPTAPSRCRPTTTAARSTAAPTRR